MTDKKTLVNLLSRNRLFDELNKKDVLALIDSAKEVDHREGQMIVVEGQPGVGFHLLLEGTAIVSRNGRKLRTLGPGETFGDIAVIDGGPRSASVQAATQLRTLSLPPWEFKPLLLEHPRIAYRLLVKLCSLLREAEKRPPL
ncbi:MAG: cyclic nucleotide-binding domain-containing protein [Candidatus Dormiibacterota bacterium]